MRGETAPWQDQREDFPSPLTRARHLEPSCGSWWLNIARASWLGAVNTRWHGPAPEAPKESIVRLGLLRRRAAPVPPRRKRSSRRRQQ